MAKTVIAKRARQYRKGTPGYYEGNQGFVEGGTGAKRSKYCINCLERGLPCYMGKQLFISFLPLSVAFGLW